MIDVFQVTNIVVALAAVAAVILAPRIAWNLTRKSQAADDRRRAKLNVFAEIMGNRASAESREAVRALNLIDVAYDDDQETRRLWQEYYALINNPAFFESALGYSLITQKRTELLAAMARNLGFPVDQFDIQRAYTPNWLREEEDLGRKERQMRLGVLSSSSRLNQPMAGGVNGTAPSNTRTGIIVSFRPVGLPDGALGLLFIGVGRIAGADAAGVTYDGTYQINAERIFLSGEAKIPAGVVLVGEQTTHSPPAPRVLPFSAELPLAFDGAEAHEVDVGGNRIAVAFEHLRDI